VVVFKTPLILHQMAQNLDPKEVSLCTGKIVFNQKVEHGGLSYQQGKLLFPLQGWAENLDGQGAAGALPRNISLTSPFISLCKTADIQKVVESGVHYQTILAWSIAISFALQAQHKRLCADGRCTLTLTKKINLSQEQLPKKDQIQLKQDYPFFYQQTDPLFHANII
jgi:hypothetical protein